MKNSSLFKEIEQTINTADVVLFMKGSAKLPACGFSQLVANILHHLKIPFKDVNVMETQELREGIKEYSNWPTIPQLYIKGEFIGGCDIVREMFQSGELQEMLKQKNLLHNEA